MITNNYTSPLEWGIIVYKTGAIYCRKNKMEKIATLFAT